MTISNVSLRGMFNGDYLLLDLGNINLSVYQIFDFNNK